MSTGIPKQPQIPLVGFNPKAPKRNDDRIILHFDYDCFYASVFENENPALKTQPLGVKQKSILATCNYVARARGVKKLQLISEAQKICPDLILVNGEDLTRFRDVSKRLWTFLRGYSWNQRVERLGLDEVFLDVTDLIAYNHSLLNPHAPKTSFFQLSERDPEKGFNFDGTRFAGHVYPPTAPRPGSTPSSVEEFLSNPVHARLLLASHLAAHLRHRLDDDFGYTSSGGVSTNKLLAKLAGSLNKPNKQTTLIHSHDSAVQDFMDSHQLRKVSGIGSRLSYIIQNHVLSLDPVAFNSHDEEQTSRLSVLDVRQHPGMSGDFLEKLLDRPGAERGGGIKVWSLLHGIDRSEVKEANDVPSQISIEDTWASRPLNSAAELMRELHALSSSLIRRMRVDLTTSPPLLQPKEKPFDSSSGDAPEQESGRPTSQRWLAHPKTLRLSTRTRARPSKANSDATIQESYARSSRSQPLSNFVFDMDSPVELLASRLVNESILPLFRRLHGDQWRHGGWNLSLINICVTNMVPTAAVGAEYDGAGSGIGNRSIAGGIGRDISHMFRTQKDKLREWTVYDSSSLSSAPADSLTGRNDMMLGKTQSPVLDRMQLSQETKPTALSTPTLSHKPESQTRASQTFPQAKQTRSQADGTYPSQQVTSPESSRYDDDTQVTLGDDCVGPGARFEAAEDTEMDIWQDDFASDAENSDFVEDNFDMTHDFSRPIAAPNEMKHSPYQQSIQEDDIDDDDNAALLASAGNSQQQQQQQQHVSHLRGPVMAPDDEFVQQEHKGYHGDEEEQEEEGIEGADNEEGGNGNACPICGHSIPAFAAAAHQRFHEMGD